MLTTQILKTQVGTQEHTERLTRESALHSALVTKLLQHQAEAQNDSRKRRTVTQSRVPQGSQNMASISELSIRTYLPSQSQRHCNPYCKCHCHTFRSLRSPSFLKAVFGCLFIGYYGNPTARASICSTASCQARVRLRACVQYLFPPWFLSKALELIILIPRIGEPRASLTLRGSQALTSGIWPLIWRDDGKGVQDYLDCGFARPNDTKAFLGPSLLVVSCPSVVA